MTFSTSSEIKAFVYNHEDSALQLGEDKKNSEGSVKKTFAKESFFGKLVALFYRATGRPNPVREAFAAKILAKYPGKAEVFLADFDRKSGKNLSAREYKQVIDKVDSQKLIDLKEKAVELENNIDKFVADFENIHPLYGSGFSAVTLSEKAKKGVGVVRELYQGYSAEMMNVSSKNFNKLVAGYKENAEKINKLENVQAASRKRGAQNGVNNYGKFTPKDESYFKKRREVSANNYAEKIAGKEFKNFNEIQEFLNNSDVKLN